MNLVDFFESYKVNQSPLPVVIFRMDMRVGTYPSFLFRCINRCIANCGYQRVSSYGEPFDTVQFKQQIQAFSFGEKYWYWLADAGELDKKSFDLLCQIMSQYTGPHTISFFIKKSDEVVLPKNGLIIDLPHLVTKDEACTIMDYLFVDQTQKIDAMLSMLYKKSATYSLNMVCLALQYLIIAGKGREQFMREWFDRIVIPDASLFDLSSHFFAQKSKSFFDVWNRIADLYSDQFWTAFWSEQIWRATWYIYYMRKHDYSEARRVAFRLPFSFTKTDWNRYQIKTLKRVHAAMYQLELDLKQGADPGRLELFYSQFLSAN